MKVFSISVVLAPPGKSCTILSSASDLSSFSFYQRGSVSEFMSFFTKTIVDRTPQGQRQSIQENSYTAHVYNRGGAEQLAGRQLVRHACVYTHADFYLVQVLLSPIRNILSDLHSRYSQKCWMTLPPRFRHPPLQTQHPYRSRKSTRICRSTRIHDRLMRS